MEPQARHGDFRRLALSHPRVIPPAREESDGPDGCCPQDEARPEMDLLLVRGEVLRPAEAGSELSEVRRRPAPVAGVREAEADARPEGRPCPGAEEGPEAAAAAARRG